MGSPNEQRKLLENMFKEMIDISASIGAWVQQAYSAKLCCGFPFDRNNAMNIVGAAINQSQDIRGTALFSDHRGRESHWNDQGIENWFENVHIASKHPVVSFNISERGISYGLSCEWKSDNPKPTLERLSPTYYHQFIHYRTWFTNVLDDEQITSRIKSEITNWRNFATSGMDGLIPGVMPNLEFIKVIPVQKGYNSIRLWEEIEELQNPDKQDKEER